MVLRHSIYTLYALYGCVPKFTVSTENL